MIPSNHTPSRQAGQSPAWQVLAEFSLPGGDNLAREQVTVAVRGLNLPPANLERLKTAVAKAIPPASEYGPPDQPDLAVLIRVLVLAQTGPAPEIDQAAEASRELQTPGPQVNGPRKRLGKAWGFFLVHKVNNEGPGQPEAVHHTLELFLYREGDLS